jgi:XapX domain-containing protein
MRPYLLAFSVGLLVGVIYSALGVKSPAPPVIALVGLLGILVGEQVVPIARRIFIGGEKPVQAVSNTCAEPILGRLPGDSKAGRRA